MEWWNWLVYDPENPILFTHIRFWVLYSVIPVIYVFTRSHLSVRNFLLLTFSLYFYYLSSGFYFFLLIFSTLVDFYIGQRIYAASDRGVRRRLVVASVVINLSVLAYFKYTYFFATSYNYWAGWLNDALGAQLLYDELDPPNFLAHFFNLFGAGMEVGSIFLPVGISFFTFQTISYSVDIYRGRLKPTRNVLDFAFYVSFFPQLVAGPIVRASDFVPQIYQHFHLRHKEMGTAIFLILAGLTKKVMVSDFIAVNLVDRVFANPEKYAGFENLWAVYGYSIQIYCDFSGYSDMAIGLALLMGFRFRLNFYSPYKATDISDFWRRWHISLSSWLRDYLYIPLGGNRHGNARTYLHLFITMLLGGLWHGASIRFLIWGCLHGLALGAHRLYAQLLGKNRASNAPQGIFSQVFYGVLTFHFVAFCWIFFRAREAEGIPAMEIIQRMLWQMVAEFGSLPLIWEIVLAKWHVLLMIVFGFFIHLMPNLWKRHGLNWFVDQPDFVKAGVVVLVSLIVYQFASADTQPFIYFQF